MRLPADTLSMMTSPGISGAYAAPAALDALLFGTSLAATRTATGVVVIDIAGVRESVEVTGRLPRVESVEPPQAAAGEIVRLRGVAFAADPDANAVTFDGVGAVVVAASRKELAVVVRAATVFAEETKPVPIEDDARRERRCMLRVFVLIRLTRFCWGCAWGET